MCSDAFFEVVINLNMSTDSVWWGLASNQTKILLVFMHAKQVSLVKKVEKGQEPNFSKGIYPLECKKFYYWNDVFNVQMGGLY